MTVQKQNKLTKGFTLIELLVVIGILAILLAITLIAINPARQFGQANDTKRKSDANAILNAIGQYAASNSGNLPGELSSGSFSTATEINSTNFPTLCTAIMPTYISAIPVDPSITSNTAPNGTSGITNCSTTPSWDTGYQVSKDSNNRITVYANDAYSGSGTISVTR